MIIPNIRINLIASKNWWWGLDQVLSTWGAWRFEQWPFLWANSKYCLPKGQSPKTWSLLVQIWCPPTQLKFSKKKNQWFRFNKKRLKLNKIFLLLFSFYSLIHSSPPKWIKLGSQKPPLLEEEERKKKNQYNYRYIQLNHPIKTFHTNKIGEKTQSIVVVLIPFGADSQCCNYFSRWPSRRCLWPCTCRRSGAWISSWRPLKTLSARQPSTPSELILAYVSPSLASSTPSSAQPGGRSPFFFFFLVHSTNQILAKSTSKRQNSLVLISVLYIFFFFFSGFVVVLGLVCDCGLNRLFLGFNLWDDS